MNWEKIIKNAINRFFHGFIAAGCMYLLTDAPHWAIIAVLLIVGFGTEEIE